jgi:hypothetical protein
MSDEVFATCSMCKKRVLYGATFFRCSVTACNAGKFKLIFCSAACFQKHLPTARHRNASIIQETAARAALP